MSLAGWVFFYLAPVLYSLVLGNRFSGLVAMQPGPFPGYETSDSGQTTARFEAARA